MGRKYTKENFQDKLDEIFHGEYVTLDEYDGYKKKILFKHNIEECMCEFLKSPEKLINSKQLCTICSNKKLSQKVTLTQDEFDKRMEILHPDMCVLEPYKGRHFKIKVKHLKCGRVLEMSTNDLLTGRGCIYCAQRKKKTTAEFISEVNELYGTKYSILGEYKTARDKIEIKHNVCGNIFSVIPTNFLRGSECPYCKHSKGEYRIDEFLHKHNIYHIHQYKINDCKHIRSLPFDFYIKISNGFVLCEYDGEQHYKPVKFGGVNEHVANKQYKLVQTRDDIKTRYCKENNISLLRVPFWDIDNINNLLSELLTKNERMVI